jgi:hypothetical protein
MKWNILFCGFCREVQIEQPKLAPCPEWPNMHKLNKEKKSSVSIFLRILWMNSNISSSLCREVFQKICSEKEDESKM